MRFARPAAVESLLEEARLHLGDLPGEGPGVLAPLLPWLRGCQRWGLSGLAPGTAVGKAEEFLHTGPTLLVDLGVVGAGWKLDQSLGGDEVS